GDCSKDVPFQYLEFFFEEDDSAIYDIKREYESGRMLAGEMKQLCIEKAGEWLEEISEKREMWRDRIGEFLAPDSN
ncbi:MAG TPA: tryptophan--tRNA ligase, partial [Acidimicrobiaceae bacterium]|nr:tryptophan--tRNA ligase [Acidimicrobiaceae bacterium]